MDSTCLVTGGSGFVGGRLIQILLSHGWQVRALARSESAVRAVRAQGAEPVRGSLDDVASLEAAARDCDVVIHVAAYFRLWGDPAEFERSNVQGTANLLQAAAGASVKRFVQLGAAAVALDRELIGNILVKSPEQCLHFLNRPLDEHYYLLTVDGAQVIYLRGNQWYEYRKEKDYHPPYYDQGHQGTHRPGKGPPADMYPAEQVNKRPPHFR